MYPMCTFTLCEAVLIKASKPWRFFCFSTCILSIRTERGSVGNVWLLRRRPRGQRARERTEGTKWVLYCEGAIMRSSASLCFLIHSLSRGQRGRGWQGIQTEMKRKMKQIKEHHKDTNDKSESRDQAAYRKRTREQEKKKRETILWFEPAWLSINK